METKFHTYLDEGLYETLINSVMNPIFLKDENHRWVFVNQAFADLYNIEPENMIGKTDIDYVDQESADRFAESDNYVLKTGKVFVSWEEISFQNNQIIAFVTYKKKIVGPDGKNYVLASLTNITEQKIIEEELREKNKFITDQNKKIETLLKEIHHRVKNNLQIIISFLNLQSYKLEGQDQKNLFQEAKNRIISMARIHEMLYQSDSFRNIDLDDYLKTLMEDLIHNYAHEDHIHLEKNIEVHDFGIDTLIPLGIILTELFSNTIKHAFNASENKENNIKVEIKQISDNTYKLIYQDNGVGFSPEQINTEKTLGLGLIDSLTEQLDGMIQYKNQPVGQCTVITFDKID